jgi:hypothetical protein
VLGVIGAGFVDETEKSLATPNVAPPEPATVMVHDTGLPARNVPAVVHETDDADVGTPYTAKLCDPPEMDVEVVRDDTVNDVEAVVGVVENTYVSPPSADESAMLGDAVELTTKSDESDVVASELASRLVMVQVMADPVR